MAVTWTRRGGREYRGELVLDGLRRGRAWDDV